MLCLTPLCLVRDKNIQSHVNTAFCKAVFSRPDSVLRSILCLHYPDIDSAARKRRSVGDEGELMEGGGSGAQCKYCCDDFVSSVTRRKCFAQEMFRSPNKLLKSQGHCTVSHRIEFHSFETSANTHI